jgi:hypothetical protein
MRFYLPFTLVLTVAAFVLGKALGNRQSASPPVPPPEVASASQIQPSQSPPLASPAFRWSQLESADYAGYIANLRKVGCPEQTIRDIVIADICHLYSQEWKRKHLAARPHYWDPEFGMGPIQSDEIQATAQQVQTALNGHVRQLLGVELAAELEKYRTIGTTHLGEEFLLSDFLPPEKVTAAAKALAAYRTRQQALEASGFLTAEQVQAAQAAREELRADLRSVLNPQEVQEVQYRFSAEAQEVRDKLVGFEVTQSEFQALHERRLQMRDQFDSRAMAGNGGQPKSPDELLSLAAQTEFGEDQIREVLGPARYEEYQRSRDERYQQLKTAATQAGLTPEWARSLYDYQRLADASSREVTENTALSVEQKEAALAEVQRQRQEQVRAWLGDDLARKLQPLLFGAR